MSVVLEVLTEELIRKKIQENGGRGIWIRGISNEDYHRGPGYSASDIKKVISKTIKKWQYDKSNPKPDTEALIHGRMIHTMSLEPHLFWEEYIKESDIPKAPARNAGEGKEKFKKWCAEYPDLLIKYGGELTSFQWQHEYLQAYEPKALGKRIIDADTLMMVESIDKNIKAHPRLAVMMVKEDCEREVSLYWIDPETDVLCKCRPDVLNNRYKVVLDPKSCNDASLSEFEGAITERDYHVAAWWYLWGTEMVFGERYSDFIYIPCEKVAPFEVTYYPADEVSLEVAEGLCRAGLIIIDRFLKERTKGVPVEKMSFSQEIKRAGIRPWARSRLQEVIYTHDLHNMGLEKFIQA